MTLYLVSWNVCGMANLKKRKLLLNWTTNFEKHHPGSIVIFFLQESHTNPNQESDFIQIKSQILSNQFLALITIVFGQT